MNAAARMQMPRAAFPFPAQAPQAPLPPVAQAIPDLDRGPGPVHEEPYLRPSLFYRWRTQRMAPPIAVRPRACQYVSAGHHWQYNGVNLYHPVLRAIAHPDCRAPIIQVPVGVVLQNAVDTICAVCVVGVALGFALAGNRAFASALVREHDYQMELLSQYAAGLLVCTVVGIPAYFLARRLLGGAS